MNRRLAQCSSSSATSATKGGQHPLLKEEMGNASGYGSDNSIALENISFPLNFLPIAMSRDTSVVTASFSPPDSEHRLLAGSGQSTAFPQDDLQPHVPSLPSACASATHFAAEQSTQAGGEGDAAEATVYWNGLRCRSTLPASMPDHFRPSFRSFNLRRALSSSTLLDGLLPADSASPTSSPLPSAPQSRTASPLGASTKETWEVIYKS